MDLSVDIYNKLNRLRNDLIEWTEPYLLYDSFEENALDTAVWDVSTSGTGGAALGAGVQVAGVLLSTGATAGGTGGLKSDQTFITCRGMANPSRQRIILEFNLEYSNLGSATAKTFTGLGGGTIIDGEDTGATGMRYNTSGYWELIKNGTVSAISTDDLNATGGSYRIKLEIVGVDSTTGTLNLYVDGVLSTSIDSSSGTLDTRELGPTFFVKNSADVDVLLYIGRVGMKHVVR